MPEPDCFLRYRVSAGTQILLRENPIGGAPLERAMVSKWFYSPWRRKTFVEGTCALPSTHLVTIKACCLMTHQKQQKSFCFF